MDKQEREYKRMDEQGWVEKVDESEEDEEEEEEEKVQGADGAGTEMGMEIVEKGMEKGTDEDRKQNLFVLFVFSFVVQ